jgi:hypothetical protein
LFSSARFIRNLHPKYIWPVLGPARALSFSRSARGAGVGVSFYS